MSEFEVTSGLILLFALRCILPFALVMVVGHLMNKLVTQWQEEDTKHAEEQGIYCSSFTKFGNQCWSKRMVEEGILPAKCVNCPIYKNAVIAY